MTIPKLVLSNTYTSAILVHEVLRRLESAGCFVAIKLVPASTTLLKKNHKKRV